MAPVQLLYETRRLPCRCCSPQKTGNVVAGGVEGSENTSGPTARPGPHYRFFFSLSLSRSNSDFVWFSPFNPRPSRVFFCFFSILFLFSKDDYIFCLILHKKLHKKLKDMQQYNNKINN